ncbi:hypothetical protein, partial [Bacteroides cellulosilyticus]|uniref:hypothetical protein n=1 Tax=Bacteroides cellulosilyticus TaxID=246787 RepID=UPI0032EC48D1
KSGVDKRKDNRTINYRKRLCQRFDTSSFFISPRSIPEPYPNRTCSVHSSVRSTSVRRNYGLGTEQVRLGYGINRTECLAAYSYRAQHR